MDTCCVSVHTVSKAMSQQELGVSSCVLHANSQDEGGNQDKQALFTIIASFFDLFFSSSNLKSITGGRDT